MKSLVLILCVLIAVTLLAVGLAGKRPRPSDGSWVPLNASGRAGLIVLAMTVALAAIAYQAGWIFPPRGATKVWTSDAAPPIGGGSAAPTVPKSLWNEAAVAQQAADARRAAGIVDEPAPVSTTKPTAPEPGSLTQAAVGEEGAQPVTAGSVDSNRSLAQVKAQLQAQVQPSSAPLPATSAAEAGPPPCDCANPPAKPAVAAKAAPATSGAAPRRSTRSTSSRSVASSRDGRVNVCEVQRRYGTDRLSYYGLTEAELRAADAYAAARSASASRSHGASSAGSVLVRNRLGPGQRAELVRISIDGGASSELRLGPGKTSGSVRLRLPAGSARYRLSGYTEFADGRRVPVDGEGWIDQGDGSLQVRTADAGDGGSLYLEPG